VLVADALGWALHQAGDDRQALGHLDTALALGWRNALMLFHRGMVEHSLGMAAAARRDLSAALDTNPNFSVTWAPVAGRALAALGGRP
jgi:tetratricopeptide (TPR) repeat protein